MKKIAPNVVAIVVLIVLNIATLSYVFFTHKGRPAFQRNDSRNSISTSIGQQLEFNENQNAQFEAFRKTYFEEIRPVYHQMREKRSQLISILKQPSDNELLVDSLTREIGELVTIQERLTHQHFMKLRSLVRPEQLSNYNDVIDRLSRYMNPGQRRGERSGRNNR